jgi:hypothetical protein
MIKTAVMPVALALAIACAPMAQADPCMTGGAKQGGYVNMQLVDSGNGMLFSMGGGDQNFPFCKLVGSSAINSADCGA